VEGNTLCHVIERYFFDLNVNGNEPMQMNAPSSGTHECTHNIANSSVMHNHLRNLSDSTNNTSKPLLDEKQAADLLDLSPGTLSVWRSTGRYSLKFIKVGRKVRYRRLDLIEWLNKRTRETGATA
jgi:hypothetical protein